VISRPVILCGMFLVAVIDNSAGVVLPGAVAAALAALNDGARS
jgi:hypothetical protein